MLPPAPYKADATSQRKESLGLTVVFLSSFGQELNTYCTRRGALEHGR
jgi:hypothetical protein